MSHIYKQFRYSRINRYLQQNKYGIKNIPFYKNIFSSKKAFVKKQSKSQIHAPSLSLQVSQKPD